MQLATECIIVALIYIEKIMTTSKIEIRFSNWRPLLFTSILLASKFWEDISFWNVDYSDALNFYPLKSINRMESEFLSLCNYDVCVSKHLYEQYYDSVRKVILSLKQKKKGKSKQNTNSIRALPRKSSEAASSMSRQSSSAHHDFRIVTSLE